MILLTAQNFEAEVLNSEIPVLVDFYADWCGPCQAVAPVIESLAEEYAGKIKVAKLNVDDNSALAQKYQIMSIPAVILFKDGQEVGRKVGIEGKEGYLKLISDA